MRDLGVVSAGGRREKGEQRMHLIITDAWLARSRAIHLSGTRLLLVGVVASVLLMIASVALYHWLVVAGVGQDGGRLGRLALNDEAAQQERFMRENLDAMARKVGEMQARLSQLDSLGERVSGLAGVSAIKPSAPAAGQGGALVASRSLSVKELDALLQELNVAAEQRSDWMTMVESRLLDEKIRKSMVPTQLPTATGVLGSPFGWRIDPLTGRSALHTGMDFQAAQGEPIVAAAGGVVVTQEYHPEYGHMVEIDHGNGLVSRYAHASKVWVKKGDLVRRGQKIADVGTTGRSTGPHLHFEVLVQGVPQNPEKFLSAGRELPNTGVVAAKSAAASGRVTSHR
jgi:murein DD-endopeptidase MepM/ murein hydrolase activator NlpD